jgi:hypothetical protein
MSLPRGVVKYSCPCGAHYLVAIETSDPAWLAVVREAASQLGMEAIDGSAPSFVCGSCGRTHTRQESPPPRTRHLATAPRGGA